MLMTIGRGLAPVANRPRFPFKRFDLTTALSPEITFVRNAPATVRNNAGKLVAVGIDEPRFDHDENKVGLGLLFEPEATNKCSNYNLNPTDTAGFVTSGTGTLSVVDDAVELANAGLDSICTGGKVYKAQATSASTFVVYIPGTCGNLNAHSLSFYARGEGTGGRTARISLGGATMDVGFVGQGYTQYKYENVVPNSTGRKFTIVVDGNDTLYFILNQLEEGTSCSSLIPVSGSTVTRPSDRAYINNIGGYSWFNPEQGYMICRYRQQTLIPADAYAAVLNDGTSANTIGLRLDQTNHNLRGYVRSNSTSQFTLANQDYQLAGIMNGAGIKWNSADVEIISGGENAQDTITQLPLNISMLEIGGRNGGASSIHGHVSYIEIGTQNLTTKQLGQRCQKSQDMVIIGAGQSLIKGYFDSVESGSEAGKQKFRDIIGQALPDVAPVLVDGSTGGSAASKTSNATNYWWDLSLNERGNSLTHFYDVIDAAGIKPTAVLWGQGEEDSHHIGVSTSGAQYKQCLEAIFADMRATLGNIPVYMQRIGRRSSFSNTGGVQAVRDIQQEMINTYDWIIE
ncbi:MAG TPA: sialate O-acetylesterase, partial [Alphaproteobacteria bacterium]|nr:sialate O-acetylesterase [Alphaproteobacteria bacterium]